MTRVRGIDKRRLWIQTKRYKWIYALFIPTLVLLIIFSYMPLLGVQIAFRDYRYAKGIWGSDFVGFKYFERMFREATFLRVLRNTLWISFLKIVIVFPGGVIFALLLNEISQPKIKRLYQTASYLPHFLSWIVLAGIMRDVLSLNGPINAIVQLLGGTPKVLLADSKLFVPILVISDLWQTMGWDSIVFLAAITGVSKELYESAEIDGAGRIRKIVSITLPSIVPVILVMFLLRIGNIMNAGFDQVFNLYSPVVYSVGDIIDTYSYRIGLINVDYSYSTAIGLFKNVVGVTLMVIVNLLSKKFSDATL